MPLTGTSVLVTGASGFIGAHLVRALVDAGARTTVLLRSDISRAWRLAGVAPRVAVCRGDITDTAALRDAVRAAQPTVVFHLAADTATRTMDARWEAVERAAEVNLLGTLRLLSAVHQVGGVRRVIRLGGLEEYGAGAMPYREAQREQPVSPYSASQVAAAHFAQMLQRHADFTIATLRPALVYGPQQDATFLIPDLVRRGLRGEPMIVHAGNRQRDLVHIDDLVRALLASITRELPPAAVVNIASGVQHSMRHVATLIHTHTGQRSALEIGERAGDPASLDELVGSGEAARELLGWVPRIALDAGIAATVEAAATAQAVTAP